MIDYNLRGWEGSIDGEDRAKKKMSCTEIMPTQKRLRGDPKYIWMDAGVWGAPPSVWPRGPDPFN